MKDEYILGVHYGHDATAVLIKNGTIVEAMSEERLSRCKKHVGFPGLALAYIKEKYHITSFDEVIVVGEDVVESADIFHTLEDNKKRRAAGPTPTKDFLRAIGARFAPIGWLYAIRDSMLISRLRRGTAGKVERFLHEQFPGTEITRINHHLAHAYATLPFMPDDKKRIILTLDGAGDNLSGSINLYEDGVVTRQSSVPISASIGLLYCGIVDLLGMTRNEHEFKVMGLAPYAKASHGEKVYDRLKQWIRFDEEQMTFISTIPLHQSTAHLIANDFHHHRFDNLAYGIQKLTEELIKDMARAAIKKYGVSDIALGGGVFMNVKANQYLREMPEVTSLVVTPSCGDESLAIGAAIYGYLQKNKDSIPRLENLYLGSDYSDAEVKQAIDAYAFTKQCTVTYFDPKSDMTIEKKVAELLAENSVVGRLKGRAEWGARALGNRSILANASSRDNVKLINEMIKGRDFWMPFATSMLYERRNEYLENADDYYAGYMAITFNTKERAHKELMAALHPYDLTSRPQMIKKEVNPEYHALISHFEEKTGIGGILNTSFNLHGEPNVENPTDALRTFELSGLPHVAIGNYLISKKK